jgi:hypothetical protein
VFAPGSPEEDHLRRHSSYIADTAGQWVTALAVLFRCVITGIVLIGLTITALRAPACSGVMGVCPACTGCGGGIA